MDFLFEIIGTSAGTVLAGFLVVLALVLIVLAALGAWPGEILASFLEDRANRNDRGKGKQNSEKYVTQ
jgi:hypothetical protein